ncbi:MAG: DUF2863 family protein, partial [Betaproteobacteria bacterium]|nr:DUF2863 family protein [Betaproteobacteria bacterium]
MGGLFLLPQDPASMKRSPAQTPPRLTRDAERLIALSTGLAASNSRMEDAYWENEISALALKLMETGHDATLSLSLDHAIQHNPTAHDVLAEMVESVAQSSHITVNDSQWDIM